MTTITTSAGIRSPMRLPIWTLGYFGTIVFANMMLLWFDPLFIAGSAIPPAIFASGFVFVLRDFAQREIGHLVLIAIVAAAGTTFWLAGPEVAIPSASAFLVAELADWIIYSVTKRPMSQRVVISSLISVPMDTAVFYALLGILDPLALALGVAIKLVGTLVFWIVLKTMETVRADAQGTQQPIMPGDSLGLVQLEFLSGRVADHAILSITKAGDKFSVFVLATGDMDTALLGAYAMDLDTPEGQKGDL